MSRSDLRSVFMGPALALRRVLHLRQVTQCAMLEEFSIFLVLADKVGVFNSDSTFIAQYRLVVICVSSRGTSAIRAQYGSSKRPSEAEWK
jgi:hypothetical protein